MPTTKFKENLNQLKKAVKIPQNTSSKVYKFEDVQGEYYKNKTLSFIKRLKDEAKNFILISEDHNAIQKLLLTIAEIEKLYSAGIDESNKAKFDLLINQIERTITTVDFKKDFLDKKKLDKEKKDAMSNYKALNIPYEIKEELLEDIEEMSRCYDANCYKASTIISGRILETALLRLYFDKSGNDLLETAPGIGLGKIIAKLSEKQIDLGPGTSEQIHLINKVRINSVHAKNDTLKPSKEQAQAIMLFTLDILKRVF